MYITAACIIITVTIAAILHVVHLGCTRCNSKHVSDKTPQLETQSMMATQLDLNTCRLNGLQMYLFINDNGYSLGQTKLSLSSGHEAPTV